MRKLLKNPFALALNVDFSGFAEVRTNLRVSKSETISERISGVNIRSGLNEIA
jgi:hypothetical protein